MWFHISGPSRRAFYNSLLAFNARLGCGCVPPARGERSVCVTPNTVAHQGVAWRSCGGGWEALSERLVFHCRTTSASAAPCTSRRMSCLTHCASYGAPCQPLLREFSGWIRSEPPTKRCHAVLGQSTISKFEAMEAGWCGAWALGHCKHPCPTCGSAAARCFKALRGGEDAGERCVGIGSSPSELNLPLPNQVRAPAPPAPWAKWATLASSRRKQPTQTAATAATRSAAPWAGLGASGGTCPPTGGSGSGGGARRRARRFLSTPLPWAPGNALLLLLYYSPA